MHILLKNKEIFTICSKKSKVKPCIIVFMQGDLFLYLIFDYCKFSLSIIDPFSSFKIIISFSRVR